MSGRLGHIPAQTADLSTPQRQQICFDYSSFDSSTHIENLHPANTRSGGRRRGVVAFAQRLPGRDRAWSEWTVAAGTDATAEAQRLLKQDNLADIYVSQAAFERRRAIAQLTAIGACFADLDYHNQPRWQGKSPSDVAAAVIGHLEEAMIPLPSYVLSTGRGLVCIWLTELLPRAALPRWNAVQGRLWATLQSFGADRRALDAARVFRLVGTENGRADHDRRTVRMVWCQGTPEAPNRYGDFGAFADEVLPIAHADLVSLRAERAKRTAAGKIPPAPTTRLTSASYHETVLTDLQRLRQYRNPTGSLPEGSRNEWLFLAGVAMAWIAPPEVLHRELVALASEVADWTDRETTARLSAVIKRTKRAAAGEKMEYAGRTIDCRYRIKAATIIERLRIDPSEQRAADLRVLVDEDRRRERGAERQKESRRRAGAKDRSDQQAERLLLGQKALHLRATEGMTRDELASHLGVSTGQVSKAMKEAEAAAGGD